MFEKCLIYTRADGQLVVEHAQEEGRKLVQTVQEEFELRTLKQGEKVTYVKRFADGTYGPFEFVAPTDGVMRLRTKAPEFRPEEDDETLERIRREQQADGRIPPDATNIAIVLLSNIPADRTYRNGWQASGGLVRHDIAKCRTLHRDRLRALRKPLLEALDAQWMRAKGQGNEDAAAVIEARRQALRDAPADPRIEAAKSVEELKAIRLPEG